MLLDRLLYPLLLALPLASYALLAGRLPARLAPSLAVLPLLLAVAALELVRPFHASWSARPGQKQLARDAASTLVLLPLVIAACDLALRPLDYGRGLWPRQAGLPLQLVLAVLLAELCFHGMHRACHRVPWLWRFHRVHHGVQVVHWLNSGTFHVVDAFINFLCYFLPLRLLGVPDPVFGWFMVLTMSTGVLEHANVRYVSGPWRLVFNTADLHRLHHSVRPEVSQKNYGKISCLWDLLFGTYFVSDDPAIVLAVGVEPPSSAARQAAPRSAS